MKPGREKQRRAFAATLKQLRKEVGGSSASAIEKVLIARIIVRVENLAHAYAGSCWVDGLTSEDLDRRAADLENDRARAV